ncbi:MAG: hypothetical protein EBY29_12040 [Planctomycetes bacterium]|nr:hypothetical protein [Planctomycetota bacterium]
MASWVFEYAAAVRGECEFVRVCLTAVEKFARGSDSPRRPTRSDLRKYVCKCSRPPAELARANFSTAETRIKQRNRKELQINRRSMF